MKVIPVEHLNAHNTNTLMQALGIQFTTVTEHYIEATMPVDHRTKQVYGLLHGGATLALAETLGSVGAMLSVDEKTQRCVGLEINGNHLRSATEGQVLGRATPIHVGKRTQVWEIKVTDQDNRLVSICRFTVAVIDAPKS